MRAKTALTSRIHAIPRACAHSPPESSANSRRTLLRPRGSIDDAARRLAESRSLCRIPAARPLAGSASCDPTTNESSIHASTRSTIEECAAGVARSTQSRGSNSRGELIRSGVRHMDSAMETAESVSPGGLKPAAIGQVRTGRPLTVFRHQGPASML